MIELLRDPKRARAMGERGRLVVEEKFSCERHLQNTLELYDELTVRRVAVRPDVALMPRERA
jgi:glycosyltransferase involved in cell wall biosynthesis